MLRDADGRTVGSVSWAGRIGFSLVWLLDSRLNSEQLGLIMANGGILSIILLAMLFTTVGCATTAQNGPVPLRTVAKGAMSGITAPRQVVIKDPATWEKLWREHNLNRRTGEALPETDFSREMLILAAMGQQRTGGFSIEITKAEIEGNRLRIQVKRTAPAPGSMNIQALTAPFHIVAVPRSDATPEFVK